MRVLLINSTCGIGSTGRICTDLATSLCEYGNDAAVAYGREAINTEFVQNHSIKIGSQKDIFIHGLISRMFDAHGFASRNATKKFIQKIKDYNPDIIHLHNIHGYYLNIEILMNFLKEWGKPIVWTMHDCWPITGHCACFDFVECSDWHTGCGNCKQMHSYPSSLFFDRSRCNFQNKQKLFSNIDNMLLVTPSNWLYNILKESFLKEYPIKVIPNGIDTEKFFPRESNLRSKYGIGQKIIVLGVSMGWPPAKHLDYMVMLAHDLGDEYQVVLIGLNKKQIKAMPDSIICLEETNNVEELTEWYSIANVFVNPTMEDNYPSVNLESQACGTPVVTFFTGGSPECIIDNFGSAVTRGNYQALKEMVKYYAKIKGTREPPTISGRKEFCEQYLALYGECLNEYRRSHVYK